MKNRMEQKTPIQKAVLFRVASAVLSGSVEGCCLQDR